MGVVWGGLGKMCSVLFLVLYAKCQWGGEG